MFDYYLLDICSLIISNVRHETELSLFGILIDNWNSNILLPSPLNTYFNLLCQMCFLQTKSCDVKVKIFLCVLNLKKYLCLYKYVWIDENGANEL